MSGAKRFLARALLIAWLTFVTGGCVIYEMYESSSPAYQPISGAVEIGTDWVEITPPTPLKSVQSQQYVSVEMKGADMWEEDLKTVKYKDGRKGKIEAFLFDEKGQSYELEIGGISGGVNLARKLPPRTPDAPPRVEPDFPRDRLYTRLRIRSEVPIRSEKIEWVCTTPK